MEDQGDAGVPRFELGTDGPSVIVVGADGSTTSVRAAVYAVGLARRSGGRVVAVRVLRMPAMASLEPSVTPYVQQTLDEAADQLRAEIEGGARYYGVTGQFREVRGDPFTELSRIADEVRADVVVVGASAQTGHRLVGSLAVRLVKAGRWPVTVVP